MGKTLVVVYVSVVLTFAFVAVHSSFVVHAEPQTIVVPDDYASIQEAINHSSSGDAIFVRAGTYEEHIVVDKSLTISGESTENTVLKVQAIPGLGVGLHVLASHVHIKGFRMTSCEPHSVLLLVDGRQVAGCWGCTVENSVLESAGDAIVILYSHDNTIASNSINAGSEGANIGVVFSQSNLIANNTVKGGYAGVDLIASTNNIIVGNTMSKQSLSAVGNPFFAGTITLDGNSNNNTVTRNTVRENEVGIHTHMVTGNVIYHNEFLNNSDQAHILESSTSIWDNGYPSGGNYWDDHVVQDQYSGVFQNETGSDGIVDTPYVMGEANRDRYPLDRPYPSVHALTVGEIDASSFVEQGSTANISTRVTNGGHFAETFNITIYANGIELLRWQNVALDSKQSVIVTMSWNTTSFETGVYLVTVTATPVAGELYLADNSLSVSVLVGIQGDVDHNGQVNLLDLWLVASHFNAHLGEPAYVADYDANHDGTIDMLDLWTCATKFGTPSE